MTALRAQSLAVIGATSIPQVLLVVLNFILNKEFEKLVFETSLGVMAVLVANVSNDLLLF